MFREPRGKEAGARVQVGGFSAREAFHGIDDEGAGHLEIALKKVLQRERIAMTIDDRLRFRFGAFDIEPFILAEDDKAIALANSRHQLPVRLGSPVLSAKPGIDDWSGNGTALSAHG